MKNIDSIRNSLVLILCVTLVFLSIGFIVLSMQLKKEKEKEESFKVVFSKVEKTSSVKGSDREPEGKVEITNKGLSLDMDLQLKTSHDELTYVATITNYGTMTAEVVGITESPNYSLERFQKMISPIMITLGDVSGKIIPPGEDITLKIIVYYPPSSGDTAPKSIPYKISLLTKSYE